MRALVLALLLAACASSPPGPGPEALRGCWIERRGDQTITQRWVREIGGAWRGDELTYFAPGADPDPARWRLKPDADGVWAMCMVELAMASAPPCWPATFVGRQAENEDDRRVEIAASEETLRITYVTGDDRAVTYDGRRDGCD